MKLVTWNVNSLRARIDLACDWLLREAPDVVCLQETKVVDELFPVEPLGAAGYRAVFSGQRTYNGVAILTRDPVDDVRILFPLGDNIEARLITAVYRGIRVYSAYIPNGRAPGTESFAMKLRWIDALGDLLFSGDLAGPPIALLGDYNVAPEPEDVYDPVALDGMIHFHPDERAAVKRLIDRGLVDAFRAKRPEPGIYSWWDYRQGAFRRNLGYRIDHVFTSPALANRVAAASVDVGERRKPGCSDHAPVVVELDV
jgi:exodeoxyribonuclease-3